MNSRHGSQLGLALLLALAGCGQAPEGTDTRAEGLPGGPSSERLTPRAVGFDGAPLGYLEYLPPGYGDGEPRPLLIYLHEWDAQGDGSEAALGAVKMLPGTIPALIAADEWPEDREFVVLSPQYAVEGECQFAEEVAAFLRFAIGRYEVDEARVYLTGISCGAEGTWDYLAKHGDELVAAAVPIAAGATAGAGCTAAAVPIWAFHGADDPIFPPGDVSPQIKKLKECDGAQVELTVYPDTFHDSWSKTYDLSADHDVYAWLLEHER